MLKSTKKSNQDRIRAFFEKYLYILTFIILLFIIILITFILRDSIDEMIISKIKSFQFNIFTVQTVQLGFLFANYGIIVSMCDKSRVRIRNKLGLMDNIYRGLLYALTSVLLSIIVMFISLLTSGLLFKIMFIVELFLLALSYIYLIIAFLPIARLVNDLRKNDDIVDIIKNDIDESEYE